VSGFAGEHAVRSHAFTVKLPIARAFPLFEPEGERAWAPGWDPQYVHPASGNPETGMVFTTAAGGEQTLWMILRHEPRSGIVEYLRVTPASRLAHVLVECLAVGDNETRVTVTYAYTGLSESGNAYVRGMDEKQYRDFIESWGAAIAAIEYA
jgi:hypothetical protein